MVYKELKGKTFNERQSECPPEYWCYPPLKDGVPDKSRTTEVWADSHAMYCPACKTNAVDTGPDASFLCPSCGLQFRLDLDAPSDIWAPGSRSSLALPATILHSFCCDHGSLRCLDLGSTRTQVSGTQFNALVETLVS